MCGRFTLVTSKTDLQIAFSRFVFPDDIEDVPRYNIAPSVEVLIVPNDTGGVVTSAKWGLVPSWARDPALGNRMINARAETLAEKPSFRQALQRRRCLVLADGFYEWTKRSGDVSKTPIYVRIRDGEPFAFAGLWEMWQSPEGDSVRSFTIITTAASPFMAAIHHRMPVILPEPDYARWLTPDAVTPDEVESLLHPYPSDEMTAYPVETLVNSPANDRAECIVPLTGPEPGPQLSIF